MILPQEIHEGLRIGRILHGNSARAHHGAHADEVSSLRPIAIFTNSPRRFPRKNSLS